MKAFIPLIIFTVLLYGCQTTEEIKIEKPLYVEFDETLHKPTGIYINITRSVDFDKSIKILQGHSGTVYALSFSPDGRILASGSSEGEIILWNVENGKSIKTFKEQPEAVTSLDFSPDGEILASGSINGNISLWDIVSGKKIKTLRDYSGSSVFSVAFSPDGKILASGNTHKIVLWDVISGRRIKALEGHSGRVYSVKFSPDGKLLASASVDKRVILWDLIPGEKLKTIRKHAGIVYSIAFSPDGRMLASGSLDRTVIVWDITNGKIIRTFGKHPEAVHTVIFSPDGKILASGSADKTIIFWDVENGKKLKSIEGHSSNVLSLSPDWSYMASDSNDKHIILANNTLSTLFYPVRSLEEQRDAELEILYAPKGEFETTAEYKERIGQAERKAKEIRKRYDPDIEAKRRHLFPYSFDVELDGYDADRGGFNAKVSYTDVFIKVPRDIAREIKRKQDKLYVKGILRYYNSDVVELLDAYLVDEISGQKYVLSKPVETTNIVSTASEDRSNYNPFVVGPPEISYSSVIEDSNNNGILEGGENIILTVKVKNVGEETAKGVKVVLSGEDALLNVIGRSRYIGKILPFEEKVVKFQGILPTELKAGNAEFTISVKESRGYSPSEVKMITVAMRPAETIKTEEIISKLVDVDIIPSKIKDYKRQDSYAIVMGISNYKAEIIPEVKYARSDAEIVAKYLENIGGIPRKNIKVLTDDRATRGYLTGYIEEWLPRRVKRDSEVFIYFAGHGTPDPRSREAYIVPYDGHPDFKSTLYPLKSMYESLDKLPAKQIVVMLDSCFSGGGGRSVMPKGARPITLSIENPVLAGGKIAVLAASTGGQISSDYDKVKHGLFTYYLLKGMKGEADINYDGKIDLRELYDYIKENVSETASIELNRDQTPVLLPDIEQDEYKHVEITRVK
jgi:uncharacterized protein with WD repeat